MMLGSGRIIFPVLISLHAAVSFQPTALSNLERLASLRLSTKTCAPTKSKNPTQLHAAATQTATGKVLNKFHDYDKPLVLIGCSSEGGNELTRLAETLVSKTKNGGSSKVIQLAAGKDEELLRSIEVENLGWPDVWILDLGDTFQEEGEDVESYYKALAEQLYGGLSIFVNVDSSSLSTAAAERKARLEEDMFVKYSDYEICIRDEGKDDDEWEHIEWEFSRLLARARLLPAIPGDTARSVNTAHLTMGLNTFFLSLSFPDIKQVEPYVEEMCKDVDAMEYRVDLLDCRDSRFELLYGMQLLRKFCRPFTTRVPALPFEGSVIEDAIPIVYTVRTTSQAGTFPDDEDGIEKMFDRLEWGLRGGVEVLDVESAWDYSKTAELLDLAEERYSSQILGSHHVLGETIETESAVRLFQQCALNGRAHGAKVVLSIDSDEKDRMAYEAALIASELAAMDGDPVIPNIALILGDVGQFSRVINLPFTPVTHETLPVKAAPGQLTSNEIMTTRLLTGFFSPLKYCILGHKIDYSVSPQMQNAAFAATKLPHQYSRFDVENIKDFVESDFFKSNEFGGASVTIPHKQSIMPYVDVLSEAAKTIGSVNTLNVKEEYIDDDFKRVVYGDNTDWKGIFNPLDRLLGGKVDSESDYALIIGAGGTARAAAYVAQKLGLKSLYFNRTPSKAADLVESFGGTVIESLEENASDGKCLGDYLGNDKGGSLRVVISTVPAASDFILPDWLLEARGIKPIVFDVNYKPYKTKLLDQAETAGCNVVRGSEMLWEQGVGQFEIWTERTAPYSVMKEVVLRNCQE